MSQDPVRAGLNALRLETEVYRQVGLRVEIDCDDA
jgi:hypothetical protein